MLPPVRVTQTELIGCICRIGERHENVGCCDPAEAPSVEHADPRDTLSYLRKHPVSQESGWVHRADALDAQLLVIASSWDRWRSERYHLRGGLSDGVFFDQLGDALGLGRNSHVRGENDPRGARRWRTGGGDPHQPARARLATLNDLLRYDEPMQDLSRRGRRARGFDPDNPQWVWLAEHGAKLAAVAYSLVAAANRYGITARRWLDELVADIADAALTPATPAVLGLAIAEVRTARPIVELTSTHAVHRMLLAGDALRCQFSGIGCHAHWQSAPPPTDVADLVRGIARRRERVDDSRRDQIPSPDAAEPADVLLFLRQSPAANRAVRALDHLAGLGLGNALWWQDRVAERAALRFGLRMGRPRDVLRRQIGASYAIKRGQGVQDRADRLASLTARGRPDEKQERGMRHSNRRTSAPNHSWVTENRAVLRCVASSMLQSAVDLQIPEGERDWLDLLAADRKDDELTATSLVTLAYAANEIQDALDKLDAAKHADVQDLLDRVDSFPTVRRVRLSAKKVDYEL